jgi:hypothetical protein
MKINNTIDKCIELMYKKIEEQEFGIKYYPEFVRTINNNCKKDDKLDKKELDDLINKRIKEYEIEIVEWKIHLNNIKSIKYETN